MTDSTQPSQEPNASDALSWLDRILNLRYALLFVSLVLAADIARTPLQALGFPIIDWRAREISVGLGTILVFATGYVMFMVGLSPTLQVIVEKPLRATGLVGRIGRFLGVNRYRPSREERYRNGQVAVYEAESRALKERDEFWIKRIDAHRAHTKSVGVQAAQLARFSFSCIVLIVGELAVSDPTSWIHIAFEWMISFDGKVEACFKIGTLVVLALMVITPWVLHLDKDAFEYLHGADSIKHPELAARRLQELGLSNSQRSPG